MVKKKKRVIWDEEARTYFKQAVAYLKSDSPQNADKIKKEILGSTKALVEEPARVHAPDKTG